MKYILMSVGMLALLAVCAAIFVGCMGKSPAGPGSINEAGEQRDASEILPVGVKAPEFDETDQAGAPLRLADFRGQSNVVLIFYPGNDTPGCTKQLCAARDDFSQYKLLDAVVIGVNPAGPDSHLRFAQKYSFPFPLIADEDGSMVRDFGCRGIGGITTRTVYVIDKDGTIVFAERGMPSTERILASLK